MALATADTPLAAAAVPVAADARNSDTVRTTGIRADQIVFAATAADVSDVIVGGQDVVRGGRHRLGEVADLLAAALERLEQR